MAKLDTLAYTIKYKAPWVYALAERCSRAGTVLLFSRRIRRARQAARLEGIVDHQPATMRTIDTHDLDAVMAMLGNMPEKHLTFFHPHGLDRKTMSQILSRRTVMTYGLFRDKSMVAYALLKLFPTRKAYIGRLVAPEMAGMGLGKFLSRFLYWQTYLLGFQPCSTIHHENVASLKSHAAVRPYEVEAELPNGFSLIRFHVLPDDATPPCLDIERRG